MPNYPNATVEEFKISRLKTFLELPALLASLNKQSTIPHRWTYPVAHGKGFDCVDKVFPVGL
jgi:hypothetical protein